MESQDVIIVTPKPRRPALQHTLEQEEKLRQSTGTLHPHRTHHEVILAALRGSPDDGLLFNQCPECQQVHQAVFSGGRGKG